MDNFSLLKAKPRQTPEVIGFSGVAWQLFGESHVDAIVELTRSLEVEDPVENCKIQR